MYAEMRHSWRVFRCIPIRASYGLLQSANERPPFSFVVVFNRKDKRMSTMAKERIAGVDLAKIIAIFFVMVHHVSDCGVDVQTGNLTLSYFHILIHSISYSCIDLFALATGFLCVNSSCRYSRIVSLWVSTVFWGVTALLFTHFCLGYSIPWKIYFNALFPIWRGQYWFFTAYFMLFFFIPCLNKSITNMTKLEFQHLLVVIGVFICGYSIYSTDLFSMRRGYSFPWLCIVYIIGAYLRIYPPRKLSSVVCFSIAALIAFITCFRQFVSAIIGFRIPGDRFCLISYVSPFTLAIAIMIFIGCINMMFSDKMSRFLKTVATTTFGVYLIHVQPFVWKNVWMAKFHSIEVGSVSGLFLIVFLFSVGTFVGLSLLEYCRLLMFSKIGIDKLICKIDDYMQIWQEVRGGQKSN